MLSIAGVELASVADVISLRYDLPAVVMQSTGEVAEGRTVSRAVMPGAEQTYGAGQPILPVVPVEIVLPYGRAVGSIDVVTGAAVTLPGSYVVEEGAESEALQSDGDAGTQGIVGCEPAMSGTFPENVFDVVGVQRERGVNILTVNLNPVRYAVGSGTVTCYTTLTLNVTLADAGAQSLDAGQAVRYRRDDLSTLEADVANPGALDTYVESASAFGYTTSGLCNPADSYRYVAITSQAMVDATNDYTINDLIASKQARGMSATVVTLESIYANYSGVDQPEQIRNFITDAYNNWETDFVLLGGDTNVVPYRGLWVNAMSGYALNIPSDMYYQCLDGGFDGDGDGYWGEPNDGSGGGDVDLRPEVYIGRASAETPAEMANWVYKTLAYQNTAGSDYRRDAMMVGEWLGFEGVSEYATATMEEIRLGTNSAGYTTAGFAANPTFTTSTLYDSATYTWSASDLKAQLNSGQHGIYNHLGHANSSYVMKLVNSDVDTLTNDNLYFMYSQGCDPGDFPNDAIAEHFTTSTRHGAAAVVFNSKNGWGARNSTDSTAQRINREFWDALFSEQMTQLGAMNADSHVDVLWGITNNLPLRWEIYQTNLLGDPAAEVVSLDLAVVGSTPVGGGVLTTLPTDFTVTFTDPCLASSVSAGDLRVNGVAANRFTLTDAYTIAFHYDASPVTTEGLQSMSIAAGAILRESDGGGNRAWNASFRYDVAPMHVTSTEPADGSIASLPLTTLRINISEPIDSASVNITDLTLSQGMVIGAACTDSDTVEYTLSGISQEGTLAVNMVAGALADTYGNPSLAYSGSLPLDFGTTAYPMPLEADAPLGSLVYRSSITGDISFAGDTDSFTLELDAGQTLTAVVVPGTGLVPTVTVSGPEGTAGPSAATEAGKQVFLETVPVATAGTYTVTVGASGATTGHYRLQLVLNAAVEAESHDGAANDEFDSAEPLDSAFLTLGTTGQRAAALGSLSVSTEDHDYYQFTLAAGQSATLALSSPAYDSTTLELYDPSRARLALGTASTNSSRVIGNFVPSAAGTYYVHLVGNASDYSLVVTKDLGFESGDGDDLGASGQVLGFIEQVTTIYPTRADFNAAFPGLPVEDFEEGRVAAGTITNFSGPAQYGITNSAFDADDILPGIAIQSDALGHPSNEMALLGAGVHGNTSKVIGSSWGSENTEILLLQETHEVGFDVLTNGSTTVTIQYFDAGDVLLGSTTIATTTAGAFFGVASSQAITRVVLVNSSVCEMVDNVTFGSVSVGGDYYRISAAAGDSLRLTTTTPGDASREFVNNLDPSIELYAPSGARVAANDNGAADGRNALVNYTAAATGNYVVRVFAMGTTGEYLLHVNGATGTAGPFAVQSPTEPAEGSGVYGASQWTIPFNDVILLSTLSASDLTVDGVGAAVAVTVVDGRTATFTLPVGLADGPHTLAIAAGAIQDLQQTPVSAWTCQFTLDITLPRVVGSSIQEGDALGSGDLALTIRFNKPMRSTNLDPGDLQLLAIRPCWSYTPASCSYDPTGTILTVTYAGLPDDSYTFTLRGGDGRFEDAAGIDLDGEPAAWPIPVNPSGNGVAGGNFRVNFTVCAGGANHPPTATDDVYTMDGNGVLDVAAPGVLANDTDPDSNPLSAVLVDAPLHGTVSLSADGSFQYTAEAGFFGLDQFTYRAHDAALGSFLPATVYLRIGPPQLVGDFQNAAAAGTPRNLIVLDGMLFFTATDALHGTELWKSDGSQNGTVMVKDICAGAGSSSPSYLTVVGNTLFFRANDGSAGAELWKSDGTTAGTVMVKDIHAGASGSSPAYLVGVNGTLYFAATDSASGTELWTSDGTAAGTLIFKNIYSGSSSSSPQSLVNAGGMLFFTATDAAGRELWASDGTAAGTLLVNDIYPGTSSSTPSNLTAAGDNLFFQANDGVHGSELWKSDGTTAGTVLVKDIYPGSSSSTLSNLTAVGDNLFFQANDGTNGYELWKSDGTTAGTFLVKDIYPGSSSSSAANMAEVNGVLFFSANDGTNGYELWKSDGTTAGTVLVKNICSGSSSSAPQALVNVAGILFCSATSTGSRELWKSDGTESGTVQVKDVNPGGYGSNPLYLTNLDGILLFNAYTTTGGQELWRSDGSEARTVLVRDMRGGTADSSPAALTVMNGTLYFSMTTTAYGAELWQSDGTAAGTSLVKDIYSGTSSSSPANLVNVGGTLFFTASDGTNGTELWRSDGTVAGTVMVRDIYSGSSSSSPTNLTNVNGTLFFTATDGSTGVELWQSDGTEGGTSLVKDIYLGSTASSIAYLTSVGGTLFFRAYDSTNGNELWMSDGTWAGTVMVKDIYAGSNSSYPSYLTAVGNTLFFQATDGSTGYELWKSDGTAAGTVMVSDIHPTGNSYPANLANVNGLLFFSAADGTNGTELWQSDGTAAGTVLVSDIWPGADGSGPASLTNVNGILFFSADDGANGIALWKSDGTAAGTVQVKDLVAGSGNPFIQNLTVVGELLYFKADDGVHGGELWRSDGSEAGTLLAADIEPGAESSDPANLLKCGRHLYFTALDAVAGRELWELTTSNLDPVALGEAYAVAEDHVLVVGATGVLANDNDPDGDPVEAQLVTGPAHGSLQLNAGGWFTYTPGANYAGPDSFTYVAFDGIAYSAVITVGITVNPVNDPPSGSDRCVTLLEDGTCTLTVADFGYSDLVDSPSHAFLAVKIAALPLAGSLKLNGTAVLAGQTIAVTDVDLGRLTFTPLANGAGIGLASFAFQVQDDGGTTDRGASLDPTPNTVTFDVTPVNDPPAGTDATKAILEDIAYFFTAADFGFSDPVDQPANALVGVLLTTAPIAGSLTFDDIPVVAGQFVSASDLSLSRLKFGTAGNTCGTAYASFTFRLKDDGGTAEGGVDLDPASRTLTIDVTPVNDEPAGSDATLSIVAGHAYDFIASDFGFSDSTDNPPNAFDRVRITTLPAQGSLMLNGEAVIAGQYVTLADINLGRLTYSASDTVCGSSYASFAFQVQDNGGTANGGVNLDSTPNALTIDVATVSVDADGNGASDALTDGIVILRYLFDPAGQWNYSDALGSGATRASRHAIKCFLDGTCGSALDVDGNGTPDALTDGILILRYLFDPNGAWNYSDALGSGATRTTRAQIRAFLEQFSPGPSSVPERTTARLAAEPVGQPVTQTVAQPEIAATAVSGPAVTTAALACLPDRPPTSETPGADETREPILPIADSVFAAGTAPPSVRAAPFPYTLPLGFGRQLLSTAIRKDDHLPSFPPVAFDPRPLDSVLREWSQPGLYPARRIWLGALANWNTLGDDAGAADDLWAEGDLDWFLMNRRD